MNRLPVHVGEMGGPCHGCGVKIDRHSRGGECPPLEVPETPTWQMSVDEAEKSKHDLATAMLMMADQLTPIFDAADGIRSDMLRRGWSETATEQAALQWLMNAMQVCWNGVGKT